MGTWDGVFAHELQYFLPNAFCVDQSRAVSEYDDYEYELKKEGVSEERTDGAYISVVTCEEKARVDSVCPKQAVFHPSCCEAWEELGKGDRCEFQSSLNAKPGEANAKSGEATVKSSGKEALVCDEEKEEVVQVKAQQVTFAKRSNGSRLRSTSFLSPLFPFLLLLVLHFLFNLLLQQRL